MFSKQKKKGRRKHSNCTSKKQQITRRGRRRKRRKEEEEEEERRRRRTGPSFSSMVFRCGEGTVLEAWRLQFEASFLSVQKATLGTSRLEA